MTPTPSLGLPARYALLTTLCTLIPVPFLDTYAENRVRRSLVRQIAARHEVILEEAAVRALADLPSGGCLGMLAAALWWPVKKLLKTIATVFLVKGLVDQASEVVHRGMMLQHAFEHGWLPGDAPRVRAAMDSALDHVDTRLVERAFFGRLRDPRGEFNAMVYAAARRPVATGHDAAAGAMEPHAARLSEAMEDAVRRTGLVPELLHWFAAELDRVPDDADDARPAPPAAPAVVVGGVEE